jgi:hypothetical protein
MELEGSLLCSKEPSTGPYPEPARANPSEGLSELNSRSGRLITSLKMEHPTKYLVCDRNIT